MATKLSAAVVAMNSGINCHVIKGDDPNILYDLLDGKDIGTVFVAPNTSLR